MPATRPAACRRPPPAASRRPGPPPSGSCSLPAPLSTSLKSRSPPAPFGCYCSSSFHPSRHPAISSCIFSEQWPWLSAQQGNRPERLPWLGTGVTVTYRLSLTGFFLHNLLVQIALYFFSLDANLWLAEKRSRRSGRWRRQRESSSEREPRANEELQLRSSRLRAALRA
jgi:hypothetical protein